MAILSHQAAMPLHVLPLKTIADASSFMKLEGVWQRLQVNGWGAFLLCNELLPS